MKSQQLLCLEVASYRRKIYASLLPKLLYDTGRGVQLFEGPIGKCKES